MKGYLEYIKTRQGTFRMTGDLIMLAGIMYLNWSPLRIISFFWLDTIVMGIFLSYFLTRQFKANILLVLPGLFFICAIMCGTYLEIFKSFNSIRTHVIPDNLLDSFKPFYETSAVLITIICSHFFDSSYFIRLIKKDPRLSLNYIFVFFGKFLTIIGTMIAMEMMKGFFNSNLNTVIPMTILIALKQYLEYKIYQAYNRHLVTPGEEKMPMI